MLAISQVSSIPPRILVERKQSELQVSPRRDLNPHVAANRIRSMNLAKTLGGKARYRFQIPSLARYAVLPLICAAALIFAGPGRTQPVPRAQASKPAAPSGAAKNTAAGKDPEVITLAGFQKILAAHRGKPLLVSFWATWCEPCRDEYPLVNELVRQYAPQGLTAFGVSLDDDAEINLVRHFLARTQPVFPNYRKRMGDTDEFDHGVDPNWQGELPVNFLYAADGKMLVRLDGERPRADYENAIRAVIAASH